MRNFSAKKTWKTVWLNKKTQKSEKTFSSLLGLRPRPLGDLQSLQLDNFIKVLKHLSNFREKTSWVSSFMSTWHFWKLRRLPMCLQHPSCRHWIIFLATFPLKKVNKNIVKTRSSPYFIYDLSTLNVVYALKFTTKKNSIKASARKKNSISFRRMMAPTWKFYETQSAAIKINFYDGRPGQKSH